MPLRVVVGSLVLVAGCSKPETAAEGKGSAAPVVPVAPRLDDPLKAPIPAMPARTGAFACKSKTPLAVVPRTRRPDHPWELPFELTECPTVPSIFGSATFGMDAATARAAAKAMGGDGSVFLSIGEHPFNQQFHFELDSSTGTLTGFSFQIDVDGFAAFKSAWGEPLEQTRFGRKLYAWFNPAARTKAVAAEDTWYRANEQTRKFEKVAAYRVRIVPYTPLVELLGPGGIIGKPLLGKTALEIAAAHPGLFYSSDQKQLERDESLPAELPKLMRVAETETGEYPTLIFCTWAGDRLEGYHFKIPYDKNDVLKRELLAQVVAALGTPIEARKGEYTFQAQNGLFVDLELGFSRDEWELKVRAK